MNYVVEIQKDCWLANWNGDPGRTLLLENAKRFKTYSAAEKALDKAREYRKLEFAKIHKADYKNSKKQISVLLSEEEIFRFIEFYKETADYFEKEENFLFKFIESLSGKPCESDLVKKEEYKKIKEGCLERFDYFSSLLKIYE